MRRSSAVGVTRGCGFTGARLEAVGHYRTLEGILPGTRIPLFPFARHGSMMDLWPCASESTPYWKPYGRAAR